jgi:hypothetical protein
MGEDSRRPGRIRRGSLSGIYHISIISSAKTSSSIGRMACRRLMISTKGVAGSLFDPLRQHTMSGTYSPSA